MYGRKKNHQRRSAEEAEAGGMCERWYGVRMTKGRKVEWVG